MDESATPPHSATPPASDTSDASGTLRVSAKEAARRATRAAMLDAATGMLLQQPGADPLTSLRPGDVVRRAAPPRTTGAFYNIWPSQADFRRDLLDHVLSLDRFQVGERTIEVLTDHLAREPFELDEMIRLAANLNIDGLKAEPAMRLKQALWSRYDSDPQIRDRLQDFYTSVSDSLLPLYGAMLERSHRQMRPGYHLQGLAVTLTALVEGLHLRWAIQPAAVPDEVAPPPGVPSGSPAAQRPWTMFASLAHTLFMSMTEPATESGG